MSSTLRAARRSLLRHSTPRPMLALRRIQQYFMSSIIFALFFCVLKHVVLIPRSDTARDSSNLLMAAYVADDVVKSSSSYVLPNAVLIESSSHNTSNPSLAPSDVTDDTSRENRPVVGVTSLAIGGEAEVKDELSSLFGTGCDVDKLGLPVHVAQQCRVLEDAVVSGNTSTSRPVACSRLTCRNILANVTTADVFKRLAAEFVESFPVHIPTDSELATIDKCETWRTKYGFDNLPPVSLDELTFPLAFNILTHRDVHQVARLLRAIYRPHNVYCVHADANAPENFRNAIKSLVGCFTNVRLASRLEHVVYAGYSRLQADINCMRDHNQSPTKWRYLINTAGQAFPLRTNAELVKILRLYNGSNDIEGIYGDRVLKGRFQKEWLENASLPYESGRTNPPPPHDIDIVRGSAYGVFNRDFVRFIVEDQRARDLLHWSRNTWSPDEFYWATLHHTFSNPHLHTPGAFSGYPSLKQWLAVYANWGDETDCYGEYIHGVCVFSVGDLPFLIRRRELFANKFFVDRFPLALDCLEAWLRHKEICPPPFDYRYYSNLTFIPKALTFDT